MLRARIDFPTTRTARPAVYTDPVRVVHATSLDRVVPALAEVERLTRDGLHAVGFVAYEAAPALDPAMATRPPTDGEHELPLVTFGLFEPPDAVADAGDARADADRPGTGAVSGATAPDDTVAHWHMETSRQAHADAVGRVRRAIAEGRTYQVNLTTRLEARFHGDPEALYHRLRRSQGGGYHALLDLGRHVLVSVSPELFFETRDRAITARPMKGTRPRGRWPEEDRALADELAASPKDRAENLMIADLLRNDLGRICVPGGIRVPSLWTIERYRTVWQMTSTVTGTLRDEVGLVDLFRALFPCGSVTGAPKISTMQLIAELEPSPRGVYCGAIGRVLPGGDCTFNVPIRTAWVDRHAHRISYGTGGGVVWDSTPAGEWDELLAKAAVVRSPWPPFEILETVGVRDGTPVRLERHIDRMAASADRFDYAFESDAVRAAIHTAARAEDTALLRVTLTDRGRVDVEPRPLDRADAPHDPSRRERVVVPAREPIDRSDPFLYHKTTHRDVYDRHLRNAPEGAWDVLLWNDAGRVTEFCRGNLVAGIGDRLLTPPRDAGLLPGCLRAELLADGRIAEVDLTLDDVRSADALWFINSARGWVPVRLLPRS